MKTQEILLNIKEDIKEIRKSSRAMNHNSTRTADAIVGIQKSQEQHVQNEGKLIGIISKESRARNRIAWVAVIGAFALVGVKLWGVI